MSNEVECRSCKERIAEGAKWCPHCQRPQSLFRALISPQALIVVAVVVGGYWYVSMATMETAMDSMGGQAIYQGSEQLEIIESSFSVTKSKCESCVYIIGEVENKTERPWSNVHFQVALMDENGEVIDVVNDEDSDFVLGPNSSGMFKVSGSATHSADRYHSHTIKITKASPDNSWY